MAKTSISRRVAKPRAVRGAGKKKKASVRHRRSAKAPKRGTCPDAFVQLRKKGGVGVTVTVAEGVDDAWEQRGESCEVPAVKGGGLSGKAVGRLRRSLPQLAPALAALGHADRARIMAKLLEGPATYRALQSLTKMNAGPLYYHLGELRAAGLILPKQRDLYELTRGGRNLSLVIAASGSLIRDKRRRPVGKQPNA